MIYFDIETRQFADKNQYNNEAGGKDLKRIGMLTFGFPTRKYKMTKKGKKRHQRVAITLPLYGGGGGGMEKRAAIAKLKSELKGMESGKFILTPAVMTKLIKIIKTGK